MLSGSPLREAVGPLAHPYHSFSTCCLHGTSGNPGVENRTLPSSGSRPNDQSFTLKDLPTRGRACTCIETSGETATRYVVRVSRRALSARVWQVGEQTPSEQARRAKRAQLAQVTAIAPLRPAKGRSSGIYAHTRDLLGVVLARKYGDFRDVLSREQHLFFFRFSYPRRHHLEKACQEILST